MAKHPEFTFTIGEVATFLGKSPVTLRGWERAGDIHFPRFNGVDSDRSLTCDDLRLVARRARELSRITEGRLNTIEASITLLQMIERENEHRNNRNPRLRKK